VTDVWLAMPLRAKNIHFSGNFEMNKGEDPKSGSQDPALVELEPSSPGLPKIIKFESLARCGEEIWIENNGQIYRLRRTKQGKLILTK